jgi:DNA-binding IscR family transcriptional regulator
MEHPLLENNESTCAERASGTETALREILFEKLDKAIVACLKEITLQDLLEAANVKADLKYPETTEQNRPRTAEKGVRKQVGDKNRI